MLTHMYTVHFYFKEKKTICDVYSFVYEVVVVYIYNPRLMQYPKQISFPDRNNIKVYGHQVKIYT